MAFLRRPVSRASLTSAALQVLTPETTRQTAPDAESLYALVKDLGQVRAALRFKSMAASKVEYYPAVQARPGEAPEKVEDGPAVEAYDRLRGLTGAFPEFVGEFAEHLDIAGEGYLIGFGGGGADSISSKDDWDVASPVEFNAARRQGYVRPDVAALPEITDADFVLRVWRQDPMRRQDPDSPLRSVQAECHQYILLRGMVTAIARSRLMAGIVKLPSGLSFPPMANGDPAPTFLDSLLEAMQASVRSFDDASRLVPIVIEGEGSILRDLDYLDMARDLPDWVTILMERVLRQIATGLDLPADILLGLADVNHWTAWLSEDSAKLDYVDPLVLLILDSLTRGYLQPALAQAGVANPEDYMFWRDYSDLIARSVGTGDAINLYDRGIISEDATRRVVGFTDSDAPDADSPDDLPPDFAAKIEAVGGLIRAGFEAEASLAALGLPVIPHTGLAPVTVQRPEDIASIVEEPVTPAGPDDVSRGTPPIPQLTASAAQASLGAIDLRLYAQLSEVGQSALDRVLEKAGQKIRSHAVGDPRRPAKHPTLAAQINGVPNGQVGLTVGPSVKATLQLTDDDLVPLNAFDAISKRVDGILEAGQNETYDAIADLTDTTPERNPDQESTLRDLAVTFLLTGLGVLALRKLFTPDLELDPAVTGEIEATQIPAPLIFDTLTIAGGGEPGFNPEAPRGLANGEQAQQWVVEAKWSIRGRVWVVGSPAKPFDPHRALRGTQFEEWSDPALSTPVTAGWLGVSFMFPGDHRGCQCVAELVIAPELVEAEEDLFPPIAAGGAHV